MPKDNTPNQIVVVGGGPVGLLAALALAKQDFQICLLVIKNRNTKHILDHRTSALFSGSIDFLNNLELWEQIAPQAEAIKTIKLVDDTNNLIRSPEISFHAEQIGLKVLGYNIPNEVLVDTLMKKIERTSKIDVKILPEIPKIELDDQKVVISVDHDSQISTKLIIGADGRNSPTRLLAGIQSQTWNYPQSALVTTFKHKKEHKGISTEFHRLSGPLTVVPMPGRRSSLVWVEKPDEAQRLSSLPEREFKKELETRLYGLLGFVEDIGPRGIFPLSGLKIQTSAKNRVALLGEAAHVLPPIGAQGLNLSMRDVACLVDCLCSAQEHNEDLGSSDVLARYNRSRSHDVSSRLFGIDIVNRSLLSDFSMPHLLRSFSIQALKTIAPLRQQFMNVGIYPPGRIPTLMRSKIFQMP